MISEDAARRQLPHALSHTEWPALGRQHRGKVRDSYVQGDTLVQITTDRLSAFDHVVGTIPFKGEILNGLALHWFEKTRDIVENHVLSVPDPNVLLAQRCEPLPVEVVVRGYITGSLWRDYQTGKAGAYGIDLPKSLRRDQAFDAPILTPTTKAEQGEHDAPISAKDIVERGLVPRRTWGEVVEIAFALFARGQQEALRRDLILVDTKYEFGMRDGRIVLIDEIHTPDSSRYWVAGEYEGRFTRGEEQRMLDKENIRQWFIQERGYSGQGTPPPVPDAVRAQLALKYAELYGRLTGEELAPHEGPVAPRIERNLRAAGLI